MTTTDKRVGVVVGAGPGLGAALGRRFAREGYRMALMARRPETLASISPPIEGALAVEVDAADEASVNRAFDQVRTELGDPEVLLYNAGAFVRGGVLELTPADFEQAWRVTCMGAFLASRAVLPAMLERGRGTILFSGATASLRGSANFSGLAVGKFGLRALAQSMARELAPRGVHVGHVVIDAMIDTARVRGMVGPRDPGTLLEPEALAETYWHLHTQDRTSWTLEIDVRPATEKF